MTAIPRVIPVLSLAHGKLVKTQRFTSPSYVGDPVNVLSIFNSFEADEIVLLDIRAGLEGRRPDFSLLEKLAQECFVPLSYGGGLNTLEDISTVISLGFEKVVIGSHAVGGKLLGEAAEVFGSQAVVAAVDGRRTAEGRFEAVVASGTRIVEGGPRAVARECERQGAGEILLQSVDRDGTMEGFDVDLVREVSSAVSVPVIACGGAGRRPDLRRPVLEGGASAVAAGSLFVYQGAHRSVLVNFPSRRQLEKLFADTPV